ncbi:ABC transporter permease [Kitasatospora purpeofusca]|uniref:ABC transporter permease n=1 Tax=Kitasatospora purpeofusca TaxID=67352 RepID=A0ABZ1U7M7_9ACTN|nr:ABC transporter permease subunit [Kitasatospora purpeofusca]
MSTSTQSGPATPSRPAAAPAANGGSAPARRRRGPSGVLWLVLHQNRPAIRSVAILLVVVSVVLVAMHVLIQDRLGAMQQSSCYTPASWERIECRVQFGRVEMLTRMFTDILQPAVTAVPVLIGMFLGGPLLAQEYERGTVRLVLTQSVTPRRWLLTRLAVPGATVLVATAVLAALTSWVWWSDIFHRPVAFDPPFQGFTYPVLGVVPVAWSLFGLALGVLVGQLLRHTAAAVLVSGVVVAIAQAVMVAWRPFFWPLVEEEQPYQNMMGGFVKPADSWLVERGVVLADGTRMMNDECFEAASVCNEAPTSWGQYHPVSHLVPIQLVEAALLLALTALVVTVVLRRLTRAGV